MTDHANELRRYARKIPHPQGETPGVMLRAADEIERLAARLEAAEKERGFAKTEIARLHDDIRELTDVRVLDEEDRDRIVAWRQGEAKAKLDNLEAAEKELAELRSSMKFRTSLIGRTEAERDALRADKATLQQMMYSLKDRLEVAEKEQVLTMKLADRLALALNTSNHERDALRAKLEATESDAAHQKALADSALRVAEGWEEKCNALRAKVAEMEKQEPVATVIKEGDSRYWMSERLWTFPDGKYPLYALPGAQGEEK